MPGVQAPDGPLDKSRRKRLRNPEFECSTCGRTEQISMSKDPIKTDAVGWLGRRTEAAALSLFLRHRQHDAPEYWQAVLNDQLADIGPRSTKPTIRAPAAVQNSTAYFWRGWPRQS